MTCKENKRKKIKQNKNNNKPYIIISNALNDGYPTGCGRHVEQQLIISTCAQILTVCTCYIVKTKL